MYIILQYIMLFINLINNWWSKDPDCVSRAIENSNWNKYKREENLLASSSYILKTKDDSKSKIVTMSHYLHNDQADIMHTKLPQK